MISTEERMEPRPMDEPWPTAEDKEYIRKCEVIALARDLLVANASAGYKAGQHVINECFKDAERFWATADAGGFIRLPALGLPGEVISEDEDRYDNGGDLICDRGEPQRDESRD